jgi:hypothetical protein
MQSFTHNVGESEMSAIAFEDGMEKLNVPFSPAREYTALEKGTFNFSHPLRKRIPRRRLQPAL